MTDSRDPVSGIRLLDKNLAYLDGAEESIRDAIEQSTDTSSWSDELWQQAATWAERYQLSPQRGNIIAPLRLGAGIRVLEIGSGTGAVTRALGESGAKVTAVEGNLERARVAAARCADLPNVEVVCGAATSFDQPASFDLVVGIGVLEYSGVTTGGSSGPAVLLAHLERQLAEDGALAIAIENQLGLKYLIGYNEDHLGLPWIGVEGYTQSSGPQTWSKKGLRELFHDAGLHSTRWLFPFPDYKFPRVILDESAYAQPDASDLIDQLCVWPTSDAADRPHLLCDDRSAHRVLVEAGIGPEVANSFLVIAARTRESVESRVSPGLAHLTGSRRRSTWQRWRRLAVAADGSRSVVVTRSATGAKHVAWLHQIKPRETPWVSGRTFEAHILESIAAGAVDKVAALLDRWSTELRSAAYTAPGHDIHPFLDSRTSHCVPGDMIDAHFSNWIIDRNNELTMIDKEWTADGGADLELVSARALIYLSHDIITHGVAHPWTPTSTVREMAATLGSLCGLQVSDELLDRWIIAESALQSIVLGVGRDEMEGNELRMLSVSAADVGVRRSLPITSMQRALADADASAIHLQLASQRVEALEREVKIEALEREVWSGRDYAITVAGELSDLRRENGWLRHEYGALTQQVRELELIRDHREEMYRSHTWRIGSLVLRPIHMVLGALRPRRNPPADQSPPE